MSDSKVSVVNTFTGEVMEFSANSPDKIADAYKQIDGLLKALDRAKRKLRDRIIELDLDGVEAGDSKFKIIHVQRTTYDKSVLREVFDEDLLDIFLVPDKKQIDTYIKENLDSLGDDSTKVRNAMINVGNAYQMVKLEKLK